MLGGWNQLIIYTFLLKTAFQDIFLCKKKQFEMLHNRLVLFIQSPNNVLINGF